MFLSFSLLVHFEHESITRKLIVFDIFQLYCLDWYACLALNSLSIFVLPPSSKWSMLLQRRRQTAPCRFLGGQRMGKVRSLTYDFTSG